MDIREADILLNVLKLPTLPASLKLEEREKIEVIRAYIDVKSIANLATRAATKVTREKGTGSTEAQATRKAANKVKAQVDRLSQKARDLVGTTNLDDISVDDLLKPTMRLTFFDPPTIFQNLVVLDIGRKVYSSPGHFIDEPHKLFESYA
jgi:carbamoylphosphate synthase small subunit